MDVPHVVHSSVDTHLSSFQLLAIVTSAAMNTVKVFIWMWYIFSTLWSILRSRIAESYGNFVRNNQTVLHSSCTIWHSHQQWTRVVPSSPHLPTLLLFPMFACFNYSHYSGSEVVSPGGSDSHFPNDWWCWASFCELICCSHSFALFSPHSIHPGNHSISIYRNQSYSFLYLHSSPFCGLP